MSDPEKNLDDLIVDAEALARLFHCSTRTIGRYTAQDTMPKIGRNRYKLVACVQWYVQHLISRSNQSDDDSIQEERRLLIKAQRQRHELEIQRRRDELIDADAVSNVLNEIATIFATHLESLAPRLAPKLAAESDPGEIQKVMLHEARSVRAATSSVVADFALSHHGVGDPRPTAERKRRRVGRPKKNASAGIA